MADARPYKAVIMREQFWFYEMREAAKLVKEGLSDDEIIEKAQGENIFQYPTERMIKRTASACLRRLHGLEDPELISALASPSTGTARQMCLYAWYFRNAMVRANYNNLQKDVHETTQYLERFLRNLLLGEKNELHNREMHIGGTFQKNREDVEPINSTEMINEPINEPLNEPIKISGREQRLLVLLHEMPDMTREQMAEKLGCSLSTVKREIKDLSDKGVLSRIGARKNGSWIIHTEKIDRDSTKYVPCIGKKV